MYAFIDFVICNDYGKNKMGTEAEIKSRPALECFVEPGKSSQKKLALLCLMLCFYRYSITVAFCGMVAVRYGAPFWTLLRCVK